MDITSEALLAHYIAYITSPEILLTLAIVILPLMYLGYTSKNAHQIASSGSESPIPGCFNLGLSRRSNLTSSPAPTRGNNDKEPKVKALFTYPLRSCLGIELGASHVEASGLKYDHSFVFASRDPADDQTKWHALNSSRHPNLKRIKLELWIPRPPADSRRSARRKDSVGKTIRERSRPRGSTQVDKLERGGVKRPVVRGDYNENGGCLVVRFPRASKFDALGVKAGDVVAKFPLEPSAERARVKNYGREKVVVEDNEETGLDLSAEVAIETMEALKIFLGVTGQMTVLHREQTRRSVSMKTVGVAGKDVSTLRDMRCNIYTTGLDASVGKGESLTALIGRRLARTSEGLGETDGDYTFTPSVESDHDATYMLRPLFERGLIRVGDDIRLLDKAGQDL